MGTLKKYHVLLIYSLLILGSFACKKVSELPSDSLKETKVNLVPEDLARQAAEAFDTATFFKPGYKIFESRSRVGLLGVNPQKANKKQIKSQMVVKDHDSIAAFYIFNYVDDGFLVVSADFNHEPVMAYVQNGHLTKGDKIPGGLAIWVRKTIFNIESLRKGLYDNTERAKRAWQEYLNVNNILPNTFNGINNNFTVITKPNIVAPPDPTIPCDQIDAITVGPLINYRWGQGCTFNDLCDLGNFYGCDLACGNDRPVTGCVATAMSQLIAYWQYPATYNFASMPRSYGNAEVQRLMANAGGSVGMKYGCSSSAVTEYYPFGPFFRNIISEALANNFGYVSAIGSKYDNSSYMNVRSNLTNGWPVILCGYGGEQQILGIDIQPLGNGHVWVCDGYFSTTYYCPQISYLYFSMNWGWYGLYNGWYAFNDWYIPSPGLNYNSFDQYIYNIHP